MRSGIGCQRFLLLVLVACGQLSCSRLLPGFDARVRQMAIPRGTWPETRSFARASRMVRATPALIHQIHFSDAEEDSKVDAGETTYAEWASYSARFGYAHRVWTVADVPVLGGLLDEAGATLLQQSLEARRFGFASELARIAILSKVGGTFVASRFHPPKLDDTWIDLRQIVPMDSLVVSPLAEGRNIGTSAILVSTDLLMAPARHPVLVRLSENLATNNERYSAARASFDEQFGVGVYPLNKALGGAYAVLSSVTREQLGIESTAK